MTATVWGPPGCGACEAEIARLAEMGYAVDKIVVEDGKESEMDRDAFAQLHAQNGMYPVIRIEMKFIVPPEILKKMDW